MRMPVALLWDTKSYKKKALVFKSGMSNNDIKTSKEAYKIIKSCY